MEPDRQNADVSLTEPPVPPTEEEQALAKKLLGEIETVLESKDWVQYVKEIELNRTYVQGKQHDDGSDELVRANLIHPEIKGMISSVYAKDPDISCAPSEAVTPERYDQVRAFGKTLELVLRSQFSPAQANLKKHAKAAIRASATSFIGWAKVVYQKDYGTDPEIENRIRDTQDDIERLEHLSKKIEKDGAGSGQSTLAEKQELEQMLKSLQQQPEVVRAEGLVIDKPMTEDVIFSMDVMDSQYIGRASWITQRIWMTVDKCTQRFGFCPSKGTRYAFDKSKTEQKVKAGIELVCVYEMWNQVNSVVYTLMEGFHGYMRPPFTPSKVGERFHGFFPLIFDPVDGCPYPLCLATLLRELQDEHNETRTNFRYHRKHSVPIWVGREGAVKPKDAKKITNAESMEVVLIEGIDGEPVRNYLEQFQNPVIDPNVYSTEHIRADWEQVTRRADASRGSVAKAKTATEASILNQGLQTDNTEAMDTAEEWLRDITQYTAELVLQEMSYEQVQRIAGEHAVWPEMDKRSVFDLVSLDIRAGSSGKPDRVREQEQWIKFLPELRETLMAIDQMEADGNGDRAEILRKLVEETLVRFDEKIDIDEFFPKKQPDEEQAEQQAKMKQQQDMEKQQQLVVAQIKAEIENVRADSILKLEDAESKNLGRQLDKIGAYLAEMDAAFNRDLSQQQNEQAMRQQTLQ